MIYNSKDLAEYQVVPHHRALNANEFMAQVSAPTLKPRCTLRRREHNDALEGVSEGEKHAIKIFFAARRKPLYPQLLPQSRRVSESTQLRLRRVNK